jgi:3',5'-cyclic AMP phosphodiesterase CpdA
MKHALILLCCGYLTWAQRIPLEEIYKPKTKPDRVILNFGADPATSMSVTWRTDTTVKEAMAEIAVSQDGPKFPESAKKFPAKTTLLKSDLNEAHYHSITFTGLTPETLYVYRVGSGEAWSEWHQFKTASNQPKPLTFIYFGDAQNDVLAMWSRVIRDSFRQASNAHFLLHAGDLINRGPKDAEWGEWHEAAGWMNAMKPVFPVPGNHEYGGRPLNEKKLTEHWQAQFTNPANGLPGLEDSNYFVDIQGVRVIGLNSNERQKEQGAWLDKLLTEKPMKWTVITFHHPIYSTAKGRDNKDIRAVWQPIFDKHGVDLVLQGHDHTYARSNINSGVDTRTGKSGTVYVVSVSGPKMYNLEQADWMARSASDTQLYQVVTVDGDFLRYKSFTAAGKLYDAFELKKQSGKPNLLTNQIPK